MVLTMNHMVNLTTPTRLQYGELDRAYDFFNERLFGASLPRCLITLQRKSKARGFFHGDRFSTWDGLEITDEIALNPATFKERTVEEILSTLVHEMAHLWQHHFGKEATPGYHNREWAAKMEELGLIPTDTGEIGGKRTGRKVTHIIRADGPFKRECDSLLSTGLNLAYVQRGEDEDEENQKTAAKNAAKKSSKTKFTCPTCNCNAWGKADLLIACGRDMVMMEADEASPLNDTPNPFEKDG